MLVFASCSSKTEGGKSSGITERGEFSWHDELKQGEAPDFPVKGMLDGKEVQFAYVNFERWRGSKDNVINFSLVKPEQKCGYIEGFSGFVLMNKGSEISNAGYNKSKFSDGSGPYQAYFKSGDQKSSVPWNCDLVIESMTEKEVTGRIALFFNDEKKSYVAGKFTAVVCNN
jgi:hypothetical protein